MSQPPGESPYQPPLSADEDQRNDDTETNKGPWYAGIKRYQWIVLLVASLGWIFDAFEGQLFVACMNQALPELMPDVSDSEKQWFKNLGLASFLIGGAVGGFLFGALSDRIGRSFALMLTILTYSLFTGVTYFAQDWYQMCVLRFLAALGTGGEWAVASAMVAEAFPPRARARAASIFHGSSVLGTMIATLIGASVVGNENLGWRPAFIIGALPAVICIFIRMFMHGSEERKASEAVQLAAANDQSTAGWRTPGVLRNLLLGVSLATIGLATFWGVHINGRQAYLNAVVDQHNVANNTDLKTDDTFFKKKEMLGMWLVTLGGGVGLFSFGPICERVGRRRAFVVFHLGAAAASLILFAGLANATPVLIAIWLPVFGYFTLGMHAGYAVYFPELFPTKIRGAASGICFNFARITAVPALLISGWLQKDTWMTQWMQTKGFLTQWMQENGSFSFYHVSTVFSTLFFVGAVLIMFGPETKGQDLPA